MNKTYIKKISLSLFVVLGYIVLFLAANFLTALIWTLFSVITKGTAPEIHDFMNSDSLSLLPSILAGLISLFLVYRLSKKENVPLRAELRLNQISVKTAGISFSLGLLFNVLTSVILYILPKAWTASYQVEMSEYTQDNMILLILCLGIVTPIVEEVYFRGLIYTMLRECFRLPVAAVISAAIFGVFHGNIVQIIYACIYGVILAIIYEKNNSLYSSILFHVGYNLCSIVFLFVTF